MFREPEELAAEEAAAKLDKLAATGRSSIRRESTIRPQRTSPRALIDRIRERNTSSSTPSPLIRDGLRDLDGLNADLDRLRRERQARAMVRSNNEALNIRRETPSRANNDYLRPEPEPRSDIDVELLSRLRADPGSAALDELNPDIGLDGLFPDTTENISQHLPRPSRESGLRFEVGATSSSDSEQSRPRRTQPSVAARRSSPPGVRRPQWSHSSLDLGIVEEATRPLYGTLTHPRIPPRIPVDRPMDSPPSENVEASYPPLRRVNHFSPRPLGGSGSRVDGLGDRLRSPSPVNDEPVEENWANLLNTMEPGRSSTATSFLSSRTDSRNGSNRSSQATTMTTSFGEIGADDTCDLDLPSGITEDDVREIRARHGRLREPLSHVSRPPRPDDLVQEAMQRYSSRGNEIVLELEVFGVILERMQRREEIPDEWWAAVGLSPDVVRGSA